MCSAAGRLYVMREVAARLRRATKVIMREHNRRIPVRPFQRRVNKVMLRFSGDSSFFDI